MSYPCEPPYTWRPVAPAPSPQTPLQDAPPAVMPVYTEIRGRRFLGGTFFRSIFPGENANKISIEYRIVDDDGEEIPEVIVERQKLICIVYYEDIEVERFGPVLTESLYYLFGDTTMGLQSANGITSNHLMRGLINGISQYIEMPLIDHGDGENLTWKRTDSLVPPDPTIITESGMTKSPKVNLNGGEGMGDITTIYTGPERLIVMVLGSEMVNNDYTDNGIISTDGAGLKQYNGITLIPYSANSDCP